MDSSSINLFLILSIFFFTPSYSRNITLFGDALLNHNSLTLTRAINCTFQPPSEPFQEPSNTDSFSAGQAFYSNSIRFLDESQETSAVSFACTFSFTITNIPSCPFGDGFAFLITSDMYSFSPYDGYMGLPEKTEASSNQDSYIALEFDTSFDPNLDDINGNHIGINVNDVRSLASVDVASKGIDLKNGRERKVWIEYRDSEKTITLWIGYFKAIRPTTPLLVADIDLADEFKEFMNVGFTASQQKGSSVYTIRDWWFKTFSGLLVPSVMSMDDAENCLLCSASVHHPSNRRNIVGFALLLGGLALLVILITATFAISCVCFTRRKILRRESSEKQIRTFQGGRTIPKMLSLHEIKSATNGFNHDKIIGEGASAVVYRGTIPSYGDVAIKRFSQEEGGNKFDPFISQMPFKNEFATMVGCLRHKNLVQLQGWCCERDELVLVYEHMVNGSLDKILHSRNSLNKLLTWERRLNVILGVSSALIYLHEECESQIIHRDVKTRNILLDSEFNAKLGDFGLAEVYRHGVRTRDATVPAGTMGYLAPEYAYTGIPTVKTDVYSFGIVVLEVVSGKRPIDDRRIVLTDYIWDLWEKGTILKAADPKLMGRFCRMEMKRTLMVGLWCTHPNSEKRPVMREALRMLRGESTVLILPVKKPTVRIQSLLPEGREEILSGCEADGDTPWDTPRTHF